ncbi:MAG: redox-sensing transcriptional repressor Rex [Pirellulaceae bacterium]|nr:redox-sensing transcriptional repressor Rex [Pirellulaceae bacterium]
MPFSDDPSATPFEQVPKAVIGRLSLYLRELQYMLKRGEKTTSSTHLGRLLGFSDTQVRKDLAYFGQFGYPGIGYRCEELMNAIKTIFGTHQRWPVALVGIGNLGRALLRYKGFSQQGFEIVSAFDIREELAGTTINEISIYHVDFLQKIISKQQIKLGIIAVPSNAAQFAADQLVEAGVLGVLNFAPVTVALPPHIHTVGVDLAIELEQLAFSVQHLQTPEAETGG